MACDLGWGPDEIDACTLVRYQRLEKQFRRTPPLRRILLAHFPVEFPKTIEEQRAEGAMGPEEFMRFVDATGGKIPGVRQR